MNSRQKVKNVFKRQSDGAGTMWTGHPNEKTIPIYAQEWGIAPSREAIYTYLDDDCRWFMSDVGYKHPEGRPAFDPSYGTERRTLSAEGCFANVPRSPQHDREASKFDMIRWRRLITKIRE